MKASTCCRALLLAFAFFQTLILVVAFWSPFVLGDGSEEEAVAEAGQRAVIRSTAGGKLNRFRNLRTWLQEGDAEGYQNVEIQWGGGIPPELSVFDEAGNMIRTVDLKQYNDIERLNSLMAELGFKRLPDDELEEKRNKRKEEKENKLREAMELRRSRLMDRAMLMQQAGVDPNVVRLLDKNVPLPSRIMELHGGDRRVLEPLDFKPLEKAGLNLPQLKKPFLPNFMAEGYGDDLGMKQVTMPPDMLMNKPDMLLNKPFRLNADLHSKERPVVRRLDLEPLEGTDLPLPGQTPFQYDDL